MIRVGTMGGDASAESRVRHISTKQNILPRRRVQYVFMLRIIPLRVTAGQRGNAMSKQALLRILWAAAALTAACPAFAASPLYAIENVTTLPSTNTGWDYVSLDAATGRLFIARSPRPALWP